ncbi:unnamed protein product [[Actinomadura] parvosata subsp. kistnae]|uniref:Rhamnogalacturonan I lyase beta-sheet domain-containing protein n=1 Tax=[Actinomadura] parvosata subsp. kistnae TaxID=1909395 RepID=A0A1V0A4Q0_9ACTN|nr:hypothetical protein [Nonomuraea sp. ATCC 55076]AQZ65173.1 hypothetical protein BKM31_30340 [Nonomuraea sp. ATCC 55076]SPL96462.1 unnamed protein product [Actinomadura parvosata subsp. kistnae]
MTKEVTPLHVKNRLPAVAAVLLLGAAPVAVPRPAAARPMENLNRGVVAVRRSGTEVLVTWRPVDEADLSTNAGAQFGLAAFQCLALVGEHI